MEMPQRPGQSFAMDSLSGLNPSFDGNASTAQNKHIMENSQLSLNPSFDGNASTAHPERDD